MAGGDEHSGTGPDPVARGILAVALIVGLLRFVSLGEWSLWIDEVYAWGDGHGARSRWPGYWLIRCTTEALGAGPTEAALRFAPAVAGWLAIPVGAWCFRPLAGPRRAALVALLLAVAAWQIQWSQTARFYTFTQVISLLGSGLVLRGVLGAHVRPWLVLLGLAVAGAAGAMHVHGFAVAGGLAAGLVIAWPGGARPRWLLPALLAGGAAGVLMAWPEWLAYREKKAHGDPAGGIGHLVLTTVAYATPVVAAMAVLSAVIGPGLRERGLRFVWAVVAVTGLALVAAAAQTKVTAQYAFALHPWILLAAAWPVAGPLRGPTLGYVGLGLAALAPQTFLYFAVEHGQRPRWREAVAHVQGAMETGDMVAALPPTPVEFYLTGGTDLRVRAHDHVVMINEWAPMRLYDHAREGRTIWIVIRREYLKSLPEEPRQALSRFLSEECRRVAEFPVPAFGRDLGVEVWRY